jgi:hypothetical protein
VKQSGSPESTLLKELPMIAIIGVIIIILGAAWGLLGGFAFHSGTNALIGGIIAGGGLIIFVIGAKFDQGSSRVMKNGFSAV